MARRAVTASLAICLGLGLLFPAGAWAQDQAAPPERQDTVMGTGGDNVSTGRDPVTGDVTFKVSPQDQPRQEYPAAPVTVQPEIRLPAGKPGRTGAHQ